MMLPSIEKLPEDLINQIKAGEVVERPASVVKELVENSIDAKSTTIFVELLDGGKQLIGISDNGLGIPAESLKLSLERHATSKLKQFSDLEKISSFGFRGEALPSIASVSEFSIKSKPELQIVGKEIQISQGKYKSEKDVQMKTGTTILVKDLFANVPARLKFLKSTSTEYSHISDFLMSVSFYYHGISFRLNHNGRDIFSFKQKPTSALRFEEILGGEAKHYAPISYERGSFRVEGFSLLPEKATGLSQYFITFVNGRLVKDKVIRAGVLQAYQGLLCKGLSPSCVLFIHCDPAWLDVNVHPAKTEVRFSDPMAIQELIAMGIQNSIKKEVNKNIASKEIVLPQQVQNFSHQPKANDFHRASPYEEIKKPHLLKMKTTSESYESKIIEPTPFKISKNEVIEKQIHSPIETNLFENKHVSDELCQSKYLGQYSNCYLLLEQNTELWIVDQHAFHERILFEEYTDQAKKNSILKQTLLTPTIVATSQNFSALALEHHTLINTLGFEFEVLTNQQLAIHSCPAFLSTNKIIETVEDLLQKLHLNEFTNEIQFYHLFYATMACHNAVRAGDPLNAELVQRLLNRSKQVDFFAHCPHGRPVLRKFQKKDVESWFLRI